MWWKQGNLTGHQLPSGTISITSSITSEAIEDNLKPDLIACIYARVSSAQNKDNKRSTSGRNEKPKRCGSS